MEISKADPASHRKGQQTEVSIRLGSQQVGGRKQLKDLAEMMGNEDQKQSWRAKTTIKMKCKG